MKFQVHYTEETYGYLTFEADSLDQAKDMVERYGNGENVEAINDGTKIERNYEFSLEYHIPVKELLHQCLLCAECANAEEQI